MKEKTNTIKNENIVQTPDGYFRYVNHADKLATTGFGTREALLKYSDNIRFDVGTIPQMQARYAELFRTNHENT